MTTEAALGGKVEIRETLPGDGLFERLFGSYSSHFPEIERNTMESTVGYVERSGKTDAWDYVCAACTVSGEIAGGAYLNAFHDIGTVFLEFVFVEDGFKGCGLGRRILGWVRERFSGYPIVLECEKDGKAVGFWNKMGFRAIDYDYVQPPITEGRKPFDGLFLMTDGYHGDMETLLEGHYFKYAFI